MDRKDMVRMTTYLVGIILLAILIQGCTTGQAYKTSPANQKEPITIGAVLILTGTGSNWGQNSRQGADLAVKELNAEGGVLGRQLKMDYEDNPNDYPASAVTALNSLTAKDVKIVIGTTWSTSGLAVAPIACDERILMISPTLGMADFNERCDYLQNIWPHDATLSAELGRHIYNKGHRRLAILGSQQNWEEEQARAVMKGFEEAGGKTVAFELPAGDSQDFKTELLT
ncbi:MAG: ABC transporter substrate-binding protein [Nanoarchaeota archaeon]